jgi:Uma2 family endonuclease
MRAEGQPFDIEIKPGLRGAALAAMQSTVRARDAGRGRLARKAPDRMSAANQLPFLMTAAVFLDWDTPDGSDRWELVDGIPRAMAPPSVRHGLIHGETGRLIGNHLAEQHPECRISIGAGLRPNDYNVRIPDITVSCGPLVDDRLLAAPIVVVEILSPSNANDTWGNVALYTTIPSVREILVLHTADVRADLLCREEDGTWPDNPLTLTLGDSVTLESINFTVPIAAFYRTA